MTKDYQVPANNTVGVFIGLLVGSLAGAVAMLLMAPQSGKETRSQIQKSGIELRDRTTELMDKVMAQLPLGKIVPDARTNANKALRDAQELAFGQLEQVVQSAQAGQQAIESAQAE